MQATEMTLVLQYEINYLQKNPRHEILKNRSLTDLSLPNSKRILTHINFIFDALGDH